MGECGRRRHDRRLPRGGGKGGTASPFHALHGSGISAALFNPQVAILRLVVTGLEQRRLLRKAIQMNTEYLHGRLDETLGNDRSVAGALLMPECGLSQTEPDANVSQRLDYIVQFHAKHNHSMGTISAARGDHFMLNKTTVSPLWNGSSQTRGWFGGAAALL